MSLRQLHQEKQTTLICIILINETCKAETERLAFLLRTLEVLGSKVAQKSYYGVRIFVSLLNL
jgi:hypothetical protein